ncbi:DUF4190 domain-containing protein [Streptomyces albidus (ex Kaewkla and Franco 2022)]|uniref:DUF4190 domain-containing protein n=1 Tax=Streptomyces albidus (ex Kaewkla and Franco 2022) TaxID=722709 RepID=UPI0015EF7F41|nr:DUF4190 domain-containing protein [Streptomyces albidus (ex Kaewkla and Franco 2022)]
MTSPQSWEQAHTGPGGAGWSGHGGGAPSGPPRNGFGVAALTLGLIGAVLFWTILGGLLLGLLAVIFGILGFRRGKRGQATNGTLAVVGAVIGGLALVASGVVLAIGISVLSSGDYEQLNDCVQRAGTQAEEQKCQEDFVKSITG